MIALPIESFLQARDFDMAHSETFSKIRHIRFYSDWSENNFTKLTTVITLIYKIGKK